MTQRDMSQEEIFQLLTASTDMTSQLMDVLRRQQQAIAPPQPTHGIQFSKRKDSTLQSGSSFDPDDNMSWSVASSQSIVASRTPASSATYRVSDFPQSSLASASSPIGVEPHNRHASRANSVQGVEVGSSGWGSDSSSFGGANFGAAVSSKTLFEYQHLQTREQPTTMQAQRTTYEPGVRAESAWAMSAFDTGQYQTAVMPNSSSGLQQANAYGNERAATRMLRNAISPKVLAVSRVSGAGAGSKFPVLHDSVQLAPSASRHMFSSLPNTTSSHGIPAHTTHAPFMAFPVGDMVLSVNSRARNADVRASASSSSRSASVYNTASSVVYNPDSTTVVRKSNMTQQQEIADLQSKVRLLADLMFSQQQVSHEHRMCQEHALQDQSDALAEQLLVLQSHASRHDDMEEHTNMLHDNIKKVDARVHVLQSGPSREQLLAQLETMQNQLADQHDLLHNVLQHVPATVSLQGQSAGPAATNQPQDSVPAPGVGSAASQGGVGTPQHGFMAQFYNWATRGDVAGPEDQMDFTHCNSVQILKLQFEIANQTKELALKKQASAASQDAR